MALTELRSSGLGPGRRERLQAPEIKYLDEDSGAGIVEIAIVGLGPWGLCVLERIVTRVRGGGRPALVHVVDPGTPGAGVYGQRQADYLILNNPCGQLSLDAFPDEGEPGPHRLGLFDWATRQGYTWHGHECLKRPGGVALKSTDFLPRRVMGEYLNWFYEAMLSDLPAGIEVVHHRQKAVDIIEQDDGTEKVCLEDETALIVDHVVLTSGHTPNAEPAALPDAVSYRAAFPIHTYEVDPQPGQPVAISGMGLVAYDLLTTFTIGRGGRFEGHAGRMHYRPSGAEPVIYLFSRSGNPYCAKPASGVDPTGDYRLVVCTPEALAAVRTKNGPVRSRRQADFRRDVLPLLFAEMQVRYYRVSAQLAGGPGPSAQVTTKLESAWAAGRFGQAIADLAAEFGQFDPAHLLFPEQGRTYASSSEYQDGVYDMVEADLREALSEGGSPLKAAADVTRILRDDLRSIIEYGGLTRESYRDFHANIRSRINRIEAGPPALRSAQLLALMEAGIVRIPFGPSPRLCREGDGVRLTSTQLGEQHSAYADMVVRGHLDLPTSNNSASPLLIRLYQAGRLTDWRDGDHPLGSVALTEDFHPLDVSGRVQERLSVLGVLTEGTRYFTHFLPSPRSRIRAVLDAHACATAFVG